MPTKFAHLIAFLVVTAISAACHYYVYSNLRRIVQRDFPKRSAQLLTFAKIIFITFDLPFVFLFFRNKYYGDLTLMTQILIYPFSMWQALMLFWTVLLIPFSIWRYGPLKRLRSRFTVGMTRV